MTDFSKKVEETTYLSADNVERYRLIMRYFFEQHRQMNNLLYRNDVLKMMQNNLPNYTESDVEQDLNQLFKWNNLTRRQEMSEPKTIEEYKNRRFRYQITEVSIEIEEMLERLSKLSLNSHGSLEKNSFTKFLTYLQELPTLFDDEEFRLKWEDLKRIFAEIGRNTSDYMAYLDHDVLNVNLNSKSFLLYKDQFVQYLRDFIINVQGLHAKIEQALINITEDTLISVYQAQVRYYRSIPRIDPDEIDVVAIKTEIFGTFQTMKSWFITTTTKNSEYELLIQQTSRMIKRITSMINKLSRDLVQYQSRRKDYLKIAEWFAQSTSLSESNRIFAGVFGLTSSKHYYGVEPKILPKSANPWLIPIEELHLDSRSRVQAQKRSIERVVVNAQAKKQLLQETIDSKQKLKVLTEQQMDHGIIRLRDGMFIAKNLRKIYLEWISLAMLNSKRIVTTIFDYQIKVSIDFNSRIKITSEDGTLVMNAVTFEKKAEATTV